MKTEWLLASKNPHKIQEIRLLLAPFGVTLLDLSSFPDHPELREEGDTFLKNAQSKAWTIALSSGKVTLADDSGLEVKYLNMAPGVYSARYADLTQMKNTPDTANNEKLMREMAGVPREKRQCWFRCVLVLADPLAKKEWSFEGCCEGILTLEPRGHDGFGYDPYFFIPELNCTMAELSMEKKNEISHRSRTLKKLAHALPAILQEGKA